MANVILALKESASLFVISALAGFASVLFNLRSKEALASGGLSSSFFGETEEWRLRPNRHTSSPYIGNLWCRGGSRN
jgi:hypothetical protein